MLHVAKKFKLLKAILVDFLPSFAEGRKSGMKMIHQKKNRGH